MKILLTRKSPALPLFIRLFPIFYINLKTLFIDKKEILLYYISMRYKSNKKGLPRCKLCFAAEELKGMAEAILRDDFILVDDGEFDLALTEKDGTFVICRTNGSVCATVDRPVTAESLLQSIPDFAETTADVGFTADKSTLSAVLGDKSVTLTETEFRLYSAIIKKGGSYVSAEELSTAVWGRFDRNLCTVYVSYLRHKLDAVFGDGTLITARGKGYRLRDTH